jgi:hypothetical protein
MYGKKFPISIMVLIWGPMRAVNLKGSEFHHGSGVQCVFAQAFYPEEGVRPPAATHDRSKLKPVAHCR